MSLLTLSLAVGLHFLFILLFQPSQLPDLERGEAGRHSSFQSAQHAWPATSPSPTFTEHSCFGVGRDSLISCSVLFDGCSGRRKGQFPQKSDNKMKIFVVERKEPREQGREPREELTGELL